MRRTGKTTTTAAFAHQRASYGTRTMPLDRLPPLREINGHKARRAARAPVRYSEEIAEEILSRMADGQSLRQICRDTHMPDPSAVIQWANKDADFAQRYARARETLADLYADELVELADSVRRGATSEEVNAARLAVDTRKWIASKLMPRRYGDKMTVEGNPDAPLQAVTRIELVAVAPSSQVNLEDLPLANLPSKGEK